LRIDGTVLFSRALVRKRKRRLFSFFMDRERSTKDITMQDRSVHTCGFQERIVRVKRIVAEIFVKATVKVVAAAASDDLNVTSAGPTNEASYNEVLHLNSWIVSGPEPQR